MKWKQFLKPDWKKIIVFLLVVLHVHLFAYSEIGVVEMSGPIIMSESAVYRSNPLLFPLSSNLVCEISYVASISWSCSHNINFYSQTNDLPDKPSIDFFFNNYFIQMYANLIYWYFVSCLMVWIYGKFKKKSKPNRS